MINAYAVGSRVYLRPLERADAPLLVGWFNDPELTTHLDRVAPLSLAAEEAFLDQLSKSNDAVILGIALPDDDRLIGTVGLHKIDPYARHAELGIAIGDRAFWGKGIGPEAIRLLVDRAFSRFNLNRVYLRVNASNPRAIRSYEKLGFQREGVLRKHAFREGRYEDVVVMAILREEWSLPSRAP